MKNGEEDIKEEIDEEVGRFNIVKIKNLLDRELVICGIYADTNARARKKWMKDGDITGNLILVKEIIEYCNENDEEGAMILMDCKKAYDRVDREAVFKVLEKMGFEKEFVEMVKVLYKEVTAMMEVEEGYRVEVKTGGGVRQGCQLSRPIPLHLCV